MLITLAVTFVLMAMEITTPNAIILCALAFLMLIGILSPDDALEGFANDGLATIGLMYIIAYSIAKSNVITRFFDHVLGNGKSEKRSLLRLLTTVSLFSPFMNNTPIVSTLTPMVQKWCRKKHLSISKFLIPLSYITILSGLITVIGTSTNLVAQGLLSKYHLQQFGFFDFAVIGIPITIVGGLYLLTIGYKILPNYKRSNVDNVMQSPNDYLIEMSVNSEFPHLNQTINAAGLRNKDSYTADFAVLCAGFRPYTDLLKGKVKMLPNGAIITDAYMRSSDPDIFAAGDSAVVHYNPTGKDDYIPLATNAIRQGVLIGHNIEKPTVKYMGTQASSAVALFGKTLASSGLTESGAQVRGVKVESVTLEQNYRPDFMLTTTPILMRLVWDPKTRVVLGGAFYSSYDCAQSANVISLAIQTKMTIDDLSMVDMFFQPNFDNPLNYVNAVATAAVQKQDGK